MTSLTQLDRIIDAWGAALPRLAISGAGADGTEHRARVALALLRRMRDNAVEGCVLIKDDSGEAYAWLAAEVVDAPKAFLFVSAEDG